MKVVKHTNSIFKSNSYVLIDGTDCWIIDVGDCKDILQIVQGLDLKGVFLTHVHYDHIYGLNKLANTIDGIRVYTNLAGQKALMDPIENLSFFHDDPFTFAYPERLVTVDDNQSVLLTSETSIQALFTPGHSETCITWFINDSIFTGDSLIPGIKTVVKLPGGDHLKSVESEQNILALAQDKHIYSGHSTHNADTILSEGDHSQYRVIR